MDPSSGSMPLEPYVANLTSRECALLIRLPREQHTGTGFTELTDSGSLGLYDICRAWETCRHLEEMRGCVVLPLDVLFALSMNCWAAEASRRAAMFRHTLWLSHGEQPYVLLALRAWSDRGRREYSALPPVEQLRLCSVQIPFLWDRPATLVAKVRVTASELDEDGCETFQLQTRARNLTEFVDGDIDDEDGAVVMLQDGVLVSTIVALVQDGTTGCVGIAMHSGQVVFTLGTSADYQRWMEQRVVPYGADLEERVLATLSGLFEDSLAGPRAGCLSLHRWSDLFERLFPGE